MARTQFTFTFQNAEPGAAVTFSAAVYSSPADQTADGPALALDTSRSVAVWADVSELTATWVDGAGTSIEAEASVDIPVVVETGGVAGASPAPSGGSVPDSWLSLGASGINAAVFSWVVNSNVGTDVVLNVDGQTIHVNTAGRYQIVPEIRVTQSADASGRITIGTSSASGVFGTINGSCNVPIRATDVGASANQRTFDVNPAWPIATFAAGDEFTISFTPDLVAGTADISAGTTSLAIVRVA